MAVNVTQVSFVVHEDLIFFHAVHVQFTFGTIMKEKHTLLYLQQFKTTFVITALFC